jgi:membrane protein
MLITLWLVGVLIGPDAVRRLALPVAALLPRNNGARAAAQALVQAAAALPVVAVIASIVPGTLYGEGLARAFDRLSGTAGTRAHGLRGRMISLLAVLWLLPLLALAALIVGRGIMSAVGAGTGGGNGRIVLGVYLTFLVGWLTLTALLVVVYRAFGSARPRPRALLWAAAATGSFVAGSSLGYVLFLGIRVDIGIAYGGSTPAAAVAIAALFLYLEHIVVLAGYVLVLRLDVRGGRPLAPSPVRDLGAGSGQVRGPRIRRAGHFGGGLPGLLQASEAAEPVVDGGQGGCVGGSQPALQPALRDGP